MVRHSSTSTPAPSLATMIPYNRLDIFPSSTAPSKHSEVNDDTGRRQQHQLHRERNHHKSLSTMQFKSITGFDSSLFHATITTMTTPQPQTTVSHHQLHKLHPPLSTSQSQHQPSVHMEGFLASLRSQTLLDYQFMRDFSLTKKKPIADRNLSRLSADSVYSMQIAQLTLDQQSRRLRCLSQSSATEAEDKVRTRTSIVANNPPPDKQRRHSSVSVRRRLFRSSTEAVQSSSHDPHVAEGHRQESTTSTTTHETLQNISNAHPSSSYFPTLWSKGQEETSNTHANNSPPYEPTTHANGRRSEHNTSENTRTSPATPVQYGRLSTPTNAGSRHHHHHNDLFESDQQKYHPRSVVENQHGFLQEQDIHTLAQHTGYNRTELYALWARFKALCSIATSPKGVDKDTFRRGIPQLSVEDQFFIDRVFAILDTDGSGILEWQEFVDALSALEKGDVTKRVGFLFRVYDLNGDGIIHRNELRQFFLASLLVPVTNEITEVAAHFIDEIFAAVGREDKETMRMKDAIEYLQAHPSTDIYSLFGRTMVTTRTSFVHADAIGVDLNI